jgi:Glyoxalase/Bleomycin resistance protein/Dioxygenase superfamily
MWKLQTKTDNRLMDNIIQVATITDSFTKTIHNLSNIFGIGPFQTFTYQLLESSLFGKSQPWSCHIVIGYIGAVQWEIIEPLEGNTLNKRYLESHGPGVHHFATEKNLTDFHTLSKHLEKKLKQNLSQHASVNAVINQKAINFPALSHRISEEIVAKYFYIDLFDKLGLDLEVIGTDIDIPLSTLMRITKNSYSYPENNESIFSTHKNSFLDNVAKLNIVTESLEEYLQVLQNIGVNDWQIITSPYHSPNKQPLPIKKIAITCVGDQIIEVQQPEQSDNYFYRQLKDYGPGIHSVSFTSQTLSYGLAQAHMIDLGIFKIYQGLNDSNEQFSLYDTQDLIGTNIELLS